VLDGVFQGAARVIEVYREQDLLDALENLDIRTLSVEVQTGAGYEQVVSPSEWARWKATVETRYKTKDRKVHPANVPLPDGINPTSCESGTADEHDRGRGNGIRAEETRASSCTRFTGRQKGLESKQS
jgi:hypothetical protein